MCKRFLEHATQPTNRRAIWWLVASLVLAFGNATGARAADPIKVNLWLPAMHCIKTTEGFNLFGIGNTDDELYMIVISSKGETARIPSEDGYYQAAEGWHLQQHGWTGHKIPAGFQPPMLWHGTIADGEEVKVLVTFADQDNKDIGQVLQVIAAIVPEVIKLLGGSSDDGAKAQMATQVVATATDKKGDDVIGGFVVFLKNNGGKLETRWEAGENCTDAGPNTFAEHGPSEESEYFNLRADGAYNVIARVTRE
jgi:hypothetical protein